jgi:2-oxoglutarate dehydrogenase E1 component
MQALYERNPGAVNDEWRLFFQSLHEEKQDHSNDAEGNGHGGPSWGRALDEIGSNGNSDLVAALTGDYGEAERNIRNKIQARQHRIDLSAAASLHDSDLIWR